MERRRILFSLFFQAMALSGIVACGDAGGQADASLPGNIETFQIANCPMQPLRPGDHLALLTEAKGSSGKNVAIAIDDFQSDRPRWVSVDAQGNLSALYPGEAQVTASVAGQLSEPCLVEVLPPDNRRQVMRWTDNDAEDHWGANNSWPMTAGGKVLWQRIDANLNTEVLLHDRRDIVGDDTKVDSIDFLSGGVDFMALGSGAKPGEVLANYRVNLMTSYLSEDGAVPKDLGDLQQEENSIADGCFFFREGGGFNDIQSFLPDSGLREIFSLGDTYTPITSACAAVWEDRGSLSSKLIYFNGMDVLPIADGLAAFPDFDFRNGRAVYASQGDVTLVDLTQDPPRVVPLSSDGNGRNDFNPRTDGESVVWIQSDGSAQHVWMYDIELGTRRKISVTTAAKKIDSLQIDLRQAAWVEGSEIWFHDGGEATLSLSVDRMGIPIDLTYRPFLKDGLLTWVGNDGDTEILAME